MEKLGFSKFSVNLNNMAAKYFGRFSIRKLCTSAVVKEEKLPRKTRIYNYFKNIAMDYKVVAEETLQDMKDTPLKSAFYLSSLGAIVYMAKTNPTEKQFHQTVLANANELLLLGDPIRNPFCDSYTQRILEAYNAGCVRRLNLGIISLIWLDNYSKEVDLVNARTKPLKVGWLDLPEKTIDIGVCGRWYFLSKSMDNYDVNPNEWGETEDRKYPPGLA